MVVENQHGVGGVDEHGPESTFTGLESGDLFGAGRYVDHKAADLGQRALAVENPHDR